MYFPNGKYMTDLRTASRAGLIQGLILGRGLGRRLLITGAAVSRPPSSRPGAGRALRGLLARCGRTRRYAGRLASELPGYVGGGLVALAVDRAVEHGGDHRADERGDDEQPHLTE